MLKKLIFCVTLNLAVAAGLPVWGAEAKERIVIVGDSITDGHTYPLLLLASLKEAGKPLPVCINAGIAGDTAEGMLARLERDVLPHRPTVVTLSAGINDVLRGVSTEGYARDMAAIADRLNEEKIPLVILTPSILGPKHAAVHEKLADYIQALRRIADEKNCRIADVHAALKTGVANGEVVLEADEVHVSVAGYKHFARALLDALGYDDVKVAQELRFELMPGVIKNWQVRPALESEAQIADGEVSDVIAKDGWQEITLPFSEPEEHWWMDQERQRGFAVSLGRRIGPAKKFFAKTEVAAESTYQGYLNVGAQVERVWLNGKLVYKSEGWTGWHAGKERISVTFDQGKNILLVESGDTYFLSVTPDRNW